MCVRTEGCNSCWLEVKCRQDGCVSGPKAVTAAGWKLSAGRMDVCPDRRL